MTRHTYEDASRRYSPTAVTVLFVAESPPASRKRYFYFPDVPTKDSLWIELMKALYPGAFGQTQQERQKKDVWLQRFQRDGFKLIDAHKDPFPRDLGSKERVRLIREQADAVIAEVNTLGPRHVMLIKATVYDALYTPLRQAGVPVINARLPFPGSGKQTEFQHRFRAIIEDGTLAGMNSSG